MDSFDSFDLFREEFEQKEALIVCDNIDERRAVTFALFNMGYDDGGRRFKSDFEYPNIQYNGADGICYSISQPGDGSYAYYVTAAEILELINGNAEPEMPVPTQDALQMFLMRG